MIRFLLYIFAGWFGYQFLKGFFQKEKSGEQVRGTRKESGLDLNREDIEDANFKDIDNSE